MKIVIGNGEWIFIAFMILSSYSPSQPLGPESRSARRRCVGRGALRDPIPSGCEGDYVSP